MMNEGLISRRYAKAFLAYATKLHAAGVVYEKMKLFYENYTSHPDLRKTLLNPVLSPQDKEVLLSTAIGIDPGEAYIRAIRLLIKNHRERYLKTIAMIYMQLYRKANGITRVNVVTATKINRELLQQIKSEVEKKVDGKTEYEFSVDPSIIGGYILNIENIQYDSSVKKELWDIRRSLEMKLYTDLNRTVVN